MLTDQRIDALEQLARFYPNGWLDRLKSAGVVAGNLLTVDDFIMATALRENRDPAKLAAQGEIVGGCGGCGG